MRRVDFNDPDLPLAEIFARWPDAASVFLARRMLCPGCPIAPFHTITDACLEYGLDEAAFRREVAQRIDAGRGPETGAPRRSARRSYP